MAFLFAIMFALNIVQLNKDVARCKKADFKEAGCSAFEKIVKK